MITLDYSIEGNARKEIGHHVITLDHTIEVNARKENGCYRITLDYSIEGSARKENGCHRVTLDYSIEGNAREENGHHSKGQTKQNETPKIEGNQIRQSKYHAQLTNMSFDQEKRTPISQLMFLLVLCNNHLKLEP